MAKSAPRPKASPNSPTALDLLKADHEEVSKLFKQFEKFKKADDSDGMQETVQAVCKALSIHAQIEEEIFYPALRDATDADDALDEADVEHSHVKELVGQLEDARPGSDHFDAQVKVLSEYVQHHVGEEEGTIFPAARKADLDLAALGDELAARKKQLAGGEEEVDAASLAARQPPTRTVNSKSTVR